MRGPAYQTDNVSALPSPTVWRAGDSGGLEAAADARADGKAARFFIARRPRELPYRRSPRGAPALHTFCLEPSPPGISRSPTKGVTSLKGKYSVTEFRYSEFRNIPSCRLVPMSGADEIRSAQ
jgi:hypothetical protein